MKLISRPLQTAGAADASSEAFMQRHLLGDAALVPTCSCGKPCETVLSRPDGSLYSLYDGRCDACQKAHFKGYTAFLAASKR